MYSGKDGRVVPLFEELFPFGGQLEADNRWLRIANLIPWKELVLGIKKSFINYIKMIN